MRTASGRACSLRFAAGIVLCLLLAGSLAAQETPAVGDGAPPSVAERVRAEVDGATPRLMGVARARFSMPLGFSVGVGTIVTRLPESHDCLAFCEYRGLVLQAEPGTTGAQIGLGFARIVSTRKPSSPFLTDIYIGWGVRGVLARTWGDSGLDPAGQTLAGVEAQFTVVRFNVSAGVARRVSSARDGADRFVYMAGFGWGF